MTVVPESEFRAKLQGMTQRLLAKLPRPVALFSVQDVPRNLRTTGWYTDPTQFDSDGSELLVQNQNFKLRSASVLAEVSVDEMRSASVRSIVFVTDYMGSGGEVERYFDFFWRNKTIRSWHSLGLIKFHLVAYGISRRAHARVSMHKYIRLAEFEEAGLDFESAPWSRAELDGVREVCRKYAANPSRALGWLGSEGLVIFGHTVPNNLPHILYQSSPPAGSHNWISFVPESRQLGLDLEEIALQIGQRPATDAALLIEKVKARSPRLSAMPTRLADRLALTSLSATHEYPLILLLVAIRNGITSELDLMSVCNMRRARLAEVRGIAERVGYLSDTGSITTLGRLFLFRHSRAVKRISTPPPQPTDPYYPRQLR